MGSCARVTSLHDDWLDCRVLKPQFLHIYVIASHEEVLIQESFRVSPGNGVLFVKVTRNHNDWEINEDNTLIALPRCISNGARDYPIWRLKVRRIFSLLLQLGKERGDMH